MIPGAFGHTGFSWDRVVSEHMFWGNQKGSLGRGCRRVRHLYFFLFVLRRAFLKYSGFSDFINDLALTLVGPHGWQGPPRFPWSPARSWGMISSSALANVAVHYGGDHHPAHEKTGYKRNSPPPSKRSPHRGTVRTAHRARRGGLIMAKIPRRPVYQRSCSRRRSAFLYYLTLLAGYFGPWLGLKGFPRAHPAAGKVLRERGHLFIPLIVLLWLMFDSYTPLFAAAASIFATVGATWLPFLIGLLRTKTARTFAFVLLLAVLGGLALSGLLGASAAILTALCVLASRVVFRRYRMTPRVVIQALDEGARSASGKGVGAACDHRHHHRHGIPHRTRPDLRVRRCSSTWVKGQLYLGSLFRRDREHHPRHGRARRGGLMSRGGRGGPVLTGVGVMPMAAHMFCLFYACLSNIARDRHVVLCGGGHCCIRIEPHVPHCGKLGLTGCHLPFFFSKTAHSCCTARPIRFWRRCGRSPQLLG